MTAPPYSRDTLQQGGAIWLYFGSAHAWERAQQQRNLGWRNVLVLPAGQHPSDFDWSCISGTCIVAIELQDTSPELRYTLVHCLAVYGARDVYLIAHSHKAADCALWNCGPACKDIA